MTLERAVEAFAGIMVLLSVALTYFVHPNWVWLTVFVGANLFQQAFTGFCPAAIIMRKVVWFEALRRGLNSHGCSGRSCRQREKRPPRPAMSLVASRRRRIPHML